MTFHRSILILMVLLMLSPNLASAQESGTQTVTLLPASQFAGNQELLADSYKDLDIKSLEFTSVLGGEIELALGADFDAPRHQRIDSQRSYWVNFTFDQINYTVLFTDDKSVEQFPIDTLFGYTKGFETYLIREESRGIEAQRIFLQTAHEPTLATVKIPVAQIQGINGNFDSGNALENIHAESGMTISTGSECQPIPAAAPTESCLIQISDKYPIDGSTLQFTHLDPGIAGKPLILKVPQPNRVSNGEEATYLYEVKIKNTLDEDRQISFSAKDVPAEWYVDFVKEILVPKKSEQTIVVAVSVPFWHEHNATKNLTLAASTLQEGEVLSQPLSVAWLTIPQPSGHHPTLYFHGRQGSYQTMLSASPPTLQEPGRVWMHPTNCVVCGENSLSMSFDDDFSLNPRLSMGLDPKLENAQFSLVLGSRFDMTIELGAELRLVAQGTGFAEGILLWSGSTSGPLNPGEPSTFQFELVPSDKLGRFEMGEGNLILKLRGGGPLSPDQIVLDLASLGPNTVNGWPEEPDRLWIEAADSSLTLPLNEYRDAPELVNGLLINLESPNIVAVAPGAMVEFRGSVNQADDRVKLSLGGKDGALAKLQTGKDGSFLVSVQVPSQAPSGQTLSVILRVQTSSGLTGLMLFEIVVSDEVPVSPGNKESSGLGFLAAGGILLLGIARRRS